MNRSIMILFTLAVLSTTAYAQKQTYVQHKNPCIQDTQGRDVGGDCLFKPFGKMFAISSAAYFGGVIYDFARSRSKINTGRYQELNPLLRTSSGGIAAVPYFGISGGLYALTVLIEKKHPKAASIVRFIGGSVHFAVGR